MKVFAPGQVLYVNSFRRADGTYCAYGVPLSGDWRDVDSYFQQITRRNVINDVVHAKVVASTGVNYSDHCGDLVDSKGRLYPSTAHDTNGNLYSTFAAFKQVEIEETYIPNYKGKKPVQPRRRMHRYRLTSGAAMCIRPYMSQGLPRVDVQCWVTTKQPSSTNPRIRCTNFMITAYCNFSYKWNWFCSSSDRPYAGAMGYALMAYCQSKFPNAKAWNEIRKDSNWRRSASTEILNSIEGTVYTVATAFGSYDKGSFYEPFNVVSAGIPSTTIPIEAGFMFHEVETEVQGIDPMLLRGHDNAHYWKNYLTQHALMEACESFPKLNDNSISNVLDVLGFIKALVVDHRIEIPRTLQDAWLTYRYSYGTTKMDVEEAIKFVRRHAKLGGLERPISCYGTSHYTFQNGVDVTCRCEMCVVPAITNTVGRLIRALDDYGLKPDFYVIWDSIPFSFMADWFLPIGDMLGVEDANAKFLSGEYYKIKWVCYSLSYTREFGNANVHYYTRWRGSVPSNLNSFYWLEPPSSSSKTTVFRVLDAASIFIGR